MPSSTFSYTVRVSSSWGSWSSMPTVAPGASSTSPPTCVSMPAMMRRSELLPEPFAPRTPIFAPCRNASVMPSSTVRSGG
jgi:hypothetical protein